MSELSIIEFLNQYGLLVVFIIVFMEYLNLPGFPSGVIMPACGVWLKATNTSFILCLLVTVIAGVLGSLILYYVGLYGSDTILNKIYKKNPSIKLKVDNIIVKLHKNAKYTVFISKLIPVVRTLVGFPCGAIKMNVKDYILYSSLGITIWNAVFILSGIFAIELFV